MSTRRNSLDVKVVPINSETKITDSNSSEELSATSMQHRSIDLKGGVTMIISLMIGSGIFTFAGEIHGYVKSTGLALCIWFVAGLLALTGALCYAELGTMIPGSGGEAQYLARGLGPLSTYLFDWASILILKPGTVALMLRSFSQYFIELIKALSSSTHFDDEVIFEYWVKGVACVGCILVTALSAYSHRWSNRILDVLTWSKVIALGLIIGGGALFCIVKDASIFTQNVLTSPFSETIPTDKTDKINYSELLSSLVMALCAGLWGFEGWNNLNIVSGDLKNPKRNLPLAIWISVGSVLGLYLATLLAYYCVVPAGVFMKSKTVGLIFGRAVFNALINEKLDWIGAALLAISIMGSTFSAALSSMMTSTEIIVLSSNNGNIPKAFGTIDKKTGTAFNAYVMQGVLSLLLTVIFSDGLITLYTFPTWIFYTLCAIVLLKLRVTSPQLERPYRVLTTTPILFLIACALLIGSLTYDKFMEVAVSLVVISAGIPVYFMYTSRANKAEK
jgi:amino acid transporter